jgi:hypothetical protein
VGVWELAFVTFGGLVFLVLDPFTLGCCNFFNSISFLTIFSAQDVPIGGIQVLFKHQKQWNPPLGSSLP